MPWAPRIVNCSWRFQAEDAALELVINPTLLDSLATVRRHGRAFLFFPCVFAGRAKGPSEVAGHMNYARRIRVVKYVCIANALVWDQPKTLAGVGPATCLSPRFASSSKPDAL